MPPANVSTHCKGGIARASTMSLAHYIINRGEDRMEAAYASSRRKRSVVLGCRGVRRVRAIARDPRVTIVNSANFGWSMA